MEPPRIYKIIAAPGIIFYARSPNIEWIADSISKGESIRTIDPAYRRVVTPAPESETVVGSYVAITREA